MSLLASLTPEIIKLEQPFKLETHEPSIQLLEKYFIYNKENGVLINRTNRYRAIAGEIAGFPSGLDGRLRTTINRQGFEISRLCFNMEYGYYPIEVDHIDRIVINNRPTNLRPSDRNHNECNKTKSSRNTSGIKGLSIHRQDNYTYWCARVYLYGVCRRKMFPHNDLGKIKAIEFLDATRKQMHEEFGCA